MSDDEEKKLADVIQFPFHKLKEKQVAEESKYMDALDQFNPNEMDDSTLMATLQSCPLYIIGDVFDPRWWARRIAWMMRIGLSTGHPGTRNRQIIMNLNTTLVIKDIGS